MHAVYQPVWNVCSYWKYIQIAVLCTAGHTIASLYIV